MDRQREDQLPNLQIQWIDNICMPLYKVCQVLYIFKFFPSKIKHAFNIYINIMIVSKSVMYIIYGMVLSDIYYIYINIFFDNL